MQLSPLFISLVTVLSLSACGVAAAPSAVIDSDVLKRGVDSMLELVVGTSVCNAWHVLNPVASDSDSANWVVGKREGEGESKHLEFTFWTTSVCNAWHVLNLVASDSDSVNWVVGKREGEGESKHLEFTFWTTIYVDIVDIDNVRWGVGKREGEGESKYLEFTFWTIIYVDIVDTDNVRWGVGKREGEGESKYLAFTFWPIIYVDVVDTDNARWGVGKREPTEAPGAWKLGQVPEITYWLDGDRSHRHVIIQYRHGIAQRGISPNHPISSIFVS